MPDAGASIGAHVSACLAASISALVVGGCERAVEPAATPPRARPDGDEAAVVPQAPGCQAVPRPPLLRFGRQPDDGCGWALFSDVIRTQAASGDSDAGLGRSIPLPGSAAPTERVEETRTPALVVLSLHPSPDSVATTVPLPEWCEMGAGCSVTATVVDQRHALVWLTGGATHPDTPRAREAFWLASAGPAFWVEPYGREAWIDGGVMLGDRVRWRPYRCVDVVWLRGEMGPNTPPIWRRWTSEGSSIVDEEGQPSADTCGPLTMEGLAHVVLQNGM